MGEFGMQWGGAITVVPGEMGKWEVEEEEGGGGGVAVWREKGWSAEHSGTEVSDIVIEHMWLSVKYPVL